MPYRIAPATVAHIASLVSLVEASPSRGRAAAGRLKCNSAISKVWAAVNDDTALPAAVWGAAPVPEFESVATFWMLALEPLDDAPAMVGLSQIVVEEMLDVFDVLENYIDAGKHQSLRLLAEVGFTIEPAILEAETGRLLRRIWIARSDLPVSSPSVRYH